MAKIKKIKNPIIVEIKQGKTLVGCSIPEDMFFDERKRKLIDTLLEHLIISFKDKVINKTI